MHHVSAIVLCGAREGFCFLVIGWMDRDLKEELMVIYLQLISIMKIN